MKVIKIIWYSALVQPLLEDCTYVLVSPFNDHVQREVAQIGHVIRLIPQYSRGARLG